MVFALDLDAALPFLFVLLPLIRSAFGAGVCDALFLPALFIVFEISFAEPNYSLNLFHNTKLTKKRILMFDIKSPEFLGGNNVHNVIIIGLCAAIAYKLYK